MIASSKKGKKLYVHQITDTYASGACIDFKNVDKAEILRIIELLKEIMNG